MLSLHRGPDSWQLPFKPSASSPELQAPARSRQARSPLGSSQSPNQYFGFRQHSPMFQNHVQSLSSLLKTDFLTGIFSSPRNPVLPKTYPEENSLLHFPLGSSFSERLCSFDFFHQSRFFFWVTNNPDGLWLTYSGKEFTGQIGRASESTGSPQRVQFRKIKTGGKDTGKVLAVGSLWEACGETWTGLLSLGMFPAAASKASVASCWGHLLQNSRLGVAPTSQVLRTHPSC